MIKSADRVTFFLVLVRNDIIRQTGASYLREIELILESIFKLNAL